MSERDDNDAPDEIEEPQSPGEEGGDLEILKAEVAALKDRSLRAMAEAENTRKRTERELDELRQYAVTKIARDLLNVSDNLARARAACSTEVHAADEALKAVAEGVEATARELQAVLANYGVKPIEAEGARFDPHLHQAIAQVPAGGQEVGTVVNVVQGGYTIGVRLLRPAMVTVAKEEDKEADKEAGGDNDSGGHTEDGI